MRFALAGMYGGGTTEAISTAWPFPGKYLGLPARWYEGLKGENRGGFPGMYSPGKELYSGFFTESLSTVLPCVGV